MPFNVTRLVLSLEKVINDEVFVRFGLAEWIIEVPNSAPHAQCHGSGIEVQFISIGYSLNMAQTAFFHEKRFHIQHHMNSWVFLPHDFRKQQLECREWGIRKCSCCGFDFPVLSFQKSTYFIVYYFSIWRTRLNLSFVYRLSQNIILIEWVAYFKTMISE